MQVYKISPILKYSPFFTLTYVSKFTFQVGNIIEIDFNNRKIYGIVIQVLDLKDAKVEIRKGEYKTKKIETKLDDKIENFLSKEQYEILKEYSQKFATSVGEVFNFIYPDFGEKYTIQNGMKKENAEVQTLLIFPDDLSLKTSPSPSLVRRGTEHAKGADIFKKILGNSFETLVIKDFNFDKYLNFQTPHISKLDLLFAFLTSLEGRSGGVLKIILETDYLGVVETNWLNENIKGGKLFGIYDLEVNEKKNIAKKYIVKTGRDKNAEEEVLSAEVVDILRGAGGARAPEKSFLFVLSHGYADRISCNDCKKPYECENCGSGYSVLNEETGRFLYCKNCKLKKVLNPDQYVICKHCGSWRVFPFGIGGQKVLEFLQNHLPERWTSPPFGKVVLVDESEKKMSVKKIKDEIQNFINSKDENVLIGSLRTLKVLQNLNAKLDYIFVVSTGPIVKGVKFDSDEKFVKLISEIENISSKVYLNKRVGDEVALDSYKDKENFVEKELVVRKTAGLPPFKKVLSLIFNYKNKRFVDKFLQQDLEGFKNAGEIKKGARFIYYWFVDPTSKMLLHADILRQFGDVVVANTIIEQSILGKK